MSIPRKISYKDIYQEVQLNMTCVYHVFKRLFICALWSPVGQGLTSLLSFVVFTVSLSLSLWYPGSDVVLDCIDS